MSARPKRTDSGAAPRPEDDEALALEGLRRVLRDPLAPPMATTNAATGLLRAIGMLGEAGEKRAPSSDALAEELAELDRLEAELEGRE